MDNQTEDTTSETATEAPPSLVDPTLNGPASLNELDVLKARANMLGVEYSNNIGVSTLRQRINDKMAGIEPEKAIAEANPLGETLEVKDPVISLRQKIMDEQIKLVRLRITCLDPKKKDLPGEIFTIANEYLGTVRKFIPFGEVTDDGYHVPFCLYTFLKEREFLNIRTIKDRRTGQTRVESNYVKEFALEVLPQLTAEELDRLATAQKAAGSVDNSLR